MKKLTQTLLMAGVILLFSLSCVQAEQKKTSFEDVKKQTQEFLQTLGGYSADQKDEAIAKTKKTLENLDTRIEALQTRLNENWSNLSEASRQKTQENLQALRQQRNKLAEMYGSMKASSGDAWENMKKGFSDAYKSIEEAWEKSEKEFTTK